MADNEGQSKKRSRFDQTEPEPKRSSRFDRRSRSPPARTSESVRSRSPLDQKSPVSSNAAGVKSPSDPAAAAGRLARCISLWATRANHMYSGGGSSHKRPNTGEERHTARRCSSDPSGESSPYPLSRCVIGFLTESRRKAQLQNPDPQVRAMGNQAQAQAISMAICTSRTATTLKTLRSMTFATDIR